MKRLFLVVAFSGLLAFVLGACSDDTVVIPDQFVWDGADYVGVTRGDKTIDIVVSPDALTWTSTDVWPDGVTAFDLCPDGFDCSFAQMPDSSVRGALVGETLIMHKPGGAAAWIVSRGASPVALTSLPAGPDDSGLVHSTGSRFWTIVDGGLLSSVDAENWSSVVMDGAVKGALEVVASAPGGHIAVTSCAGVGPGPQCQAMFSNNDGAGWSTRLDMTEEQQVIAVGPAGMLVEDRPLSAERRVSLFDVGAELARTTTIGSDLPIWATVDQMGALVTQRRIDASPLIWRLNR